MYEFCYSVHECLQDVEGIMELSEWRQTRREHDFYVHRMLKVKSVQADGFGDCLTNSLTVPTR